MDAQKERSSDDYLTELFEKSTSSSIEDKMRSIDIFLETLSIHPYPLTVNSAVLMMADLFSHPDTNNNLRYAIYRSFFIINTKKDKNNTHKDKHENLFDANKIINHEEIIRRLMIVLESNDPTARAISFLLFSELRHLIKDVSYVHHLMLNALESHYEIELKAAIHAIDKTSKTMASHPELSSALYNRVSSMIKTASNMPIDTKLKLIDLLKHMGCYQSSHAIKTYNLCSYLLETYPIHQCIKFTLNVMTKIVTSNPKDLFIPYSQKLVNFIIHDSRLNIKILSLKQLGSLYKSKNFINLNQLEYFVWFNDLMAYLTNIIDEDSKLKAKIIDQKSIIAHKKPSHTELLAKILDVLKCMAKHSPIHILEYKSQNIYKLFTYIMNYPSQEEIRYSSAELLSILLNDDLKIAMDANEKELNNVIKQYVKFSFLISQMLLKQNISEPKSLNILLRCILYIYKSLLAVPEKQYGSKEWYKDVVMSRNRLFQTLIKKISRLFTDEQIHEDCIATARHICKYYGIYQFPEELLEFLSQNLVKPLEEKVESWKDNKFQLDCSILVFCCTLLFRIFRSTPHQNKYKQLTISIIRKLLVYLLNQNKFWVCYVISREAITWGFYTPVIIQDEKTNQYDSIFNQIKLNASLQESINSDWLSILNNISISNYKLISGEAYSSNYLLSSKLLVSKIFKHSNEENFQERFLTLSNEYYSSLESYKNILRSFKKTFYDNYKIHGVNLQTVKIPQLILLNLDKLMKIFNNLSDSFDALSRISFAIDEDSFNRIKSVSLLSKVIVLFINELNVIRAILSKEQNIDDLKTSQAELISKMALCKPKISIYLFENCSSLKSVTSCLLKFITEESLSLNNENSIEDIYKKFQRIYDWTLRLYSIPLDTPIYFFKLNQKSEVKLKISPYPEIPSEVLVVREKKYPSTLSLTFNGFIREKGNRNLEYISLEIDIKAMNDEENTTYEKISTSFPLIDGKSFSGKSDIKFPRPDLYQLQIICELKDNQGRKWFGPKYILTVRVL